MPFFPSFPTGTRLHAIVKFPSPPTTTMRFPTAVIAVLGLAGTWWLSRRRIRDRAQQRLERVIAAAACGNLDEIGELLWGDDASAQCAALGVLAACTPTERALYVDRIGWLLQWSEEASVQCAALGVFAACTPTERALYVDRIGWLLQWSEEASVQCAALGVFAACTPTERAVHMERIGEVLDWNEEASVQCAALGVFAACTPTERALHMERIGELLELSEEASIQCAALGVFAACTPTERALHVDRVRELQWNDDASVGWAAAQVLAAGCAGDGGASTGTNAECQQPSMSTEELSLVGREIQMLQDKNGMKRGDRASVVRPNRNNSAWILDNGRLVQMNQAEESWQVLPGSSDDASDDAFARTQLALCLAFPPLVGHRPRKLELASHSKQDKLLRVYHQRTLVNADGQAKEVDVVAENIARFPVVFQITAYVEKGGERLDCELVLPGKLARLATCTTEEPWEHTFDDAPHFCCAGLGKRDFAQQLTVVVQPAAMVDKDRWRAVSVPGEVWNMYVTADFALPYPMPIYLEHKRERFADLPAELSAQNRAQIAVLSEANVARLPSSRSVDQDAASRRAGHDARDRDDATSLSSVPTSHVTLRSTEHSRARLAERQIQKRLLQAAKKHAPAERWTPGKRHRKGPTWKVEWDGVVLITDNAKKIVITAYPTNGQQR